MDHKKDSQFVDELLEASLARYSSVTPRPGLEGRVLAHARAVQERRTWFVWAGWLVAGAAAVVIAVGILNFAHNRAIPDLPKPAGVVTTAQVPEKIPGPAIVPKERVHSAGRVFSQPVMRAASRRMEDDPHMAVFPSPQSETAEERLISQFVHNTPPSVLATLPENSKEIPNLEIKSLDLPPSVLGISLEDPKEIPDLEIKSLDIPPLVSDADETKNN